MREPTFVIVVRVFPDDKGRLMHRILETVMTSDGPRTRVVDGQWSTLVAAATELELIKARLHDGTTL